MDWNTELAQGLRSTGIAWDKIGRVFGVTGDTVKIRLDPAYAERRRDANNTRRQVERAAARAVIDAPPMAPVASDQAGTFMTPSGIMAYHKYVPNRISLASIPLNEGTAMKAISLPFVSILRGS